MVSRLALLVLRAPVLNGWSGAVVVPRAKNYGTRQESRPWKQRPNRKARLSIILTEDVPNLGLKGQIVKVKHGYARNCLLPKGTAVYATPENVKLYDAREIEEGADRKGVNYVDFLQNFLSDKDLRIEKNSATRWGVFEQDISTALRKSLQLHVPLDCIELKNPLSTFGDHSVDVRLDESTLVTIPVHVTKKLPKVRQKKKEETEFSS